MDREERNRERQFWVVDPAMFQRRTRQSLVSRFFLYPAKILGGFAGVGLLFIYPIVLVSMGLLFGGVAFWSFFLVSIGLIGLVIKKAGYARNFESWNPSLTRQLMGLLLGFLVCASFYLGLFVMKTWFLPLVAVVLVAVLSYIIYR